MIVDWIYNHPTWMWGSILVVGTTLLACLGLAIVHPLVDVRVRRAHNDLAGFSIAIISLVYAVLLAFIAVATWEAFSSADVLVQEEAGYIGNLYRDTRGFPDTVGQAMRKALEDYAEAVIHQEWPVQQQGRLPNAGWMPLNNLRSELIGYQPETRGEAVVEAEFLRSLDELYRAREARLTAAASHIPSVIWWIIAFGGLLTVAFTYLFGFESFGLHLTMTGAVAASLALVVVLIVALDWPFRGEVSVTPEAYENVVNGWKSTSTSSLPQIGNGFEGSTHR
jgi:Protein of unknown function (DUF4239)